MGDPLTTAKSPELLNRLFMEQGADAVCVPLEVKGSDLSAFVKGARAVGNLSGLLVTMPHNQRLGSWLSSLLMEGRCHE
jgi:shikimate dehydrogenase